MARINRIALGVMFAGSAVLGALAFRAATSEAGPANLHSSSDAGPHALHAAIDPGTLAPPALVDAETISLFDLDATWRDQAGVPRTLEEAARGRVAVVTMLYTNCAVACPRLVADLKRIEGALTAAQRRRVTFVVTSMDPARDTPERLAEWGAATHLDPAGWTLLTGSDETVRELAAALGVRYTMLPGGEVAHSNRIVVLDGAGAPVHWQLGVGEAAGVDATAEAVALALSTRASSPPRTVP